MIYARKLVILVIVIIAAITFSICFANEKEKEMNINWVGYLVSGKILTDDQGILPEQLNSPPTVDRTIAIGLREDSVLVWKQIEKNITSLQ